MATDVTVEQHNLLERLEAALARFGAKNPRFIDTSANTATILGYLSAHKLGLSEKTLQEAYDALSAKGKLELRPANPAPAPTKATSAPATATPLPPLNVQYLAVYMDNAGNTYSCPAVWSGSAWVLDSAYGRKPLTFYLEDGLEFMDFEFAADGRMREADFLAAEREMRRVLRAPARPATRPPVPEPAPADHRLHIDERHPGESSWSAARRAVAQQAAQGLAEQQARRRSGPVPGPSPAGRRVAALAEAANARRNEMQRGRGGPYREGTEETP